jgi:hypothetical protein
MPTHSFSDADMLNEDDLANQSVVLKEQQLVKEQERVRHITSSRVNFIKSYFLALQLREYELRAQHEINLMKQQLMAKEEALKSVISFYVPSTWSDTIFTGTSKLAPSRNPALLTDLSA